MIKKLIIFSLLVSQLCFASFNVYEFKDKQQEARFKALITELRCPKCQNNNLADSAADLATDIKNLVYRSILEGKTDDEIRDYLISRYGEFVTYKPPFKGGNIIVWLLPLILMIITIIIVLFKRSKKVITETPQTMKQIIDDYQNQQEKE